jgi:hypothetical protein
MIYAKATFLEHGFVITDTGGGCRAWHKIVSGSRGVFHALITDSDGNLPEYGDIVSGIYSDDGDGGWNDAECIFDDTADYAVDCLAELIPALNYYSGDSK